MKAAVADGIVITGYIDQGAFLNFTGPNINFSTKNSRFGLGMLRSLRFKEDNASPENAWITPDPGIGLTCCYKFVAIQLPFCYNAKNGCGKREMACRHWDRLEIERG